MKCKCVLNAIAAMGITPLIVHASPARRLSHFVKNWEQVAKDSWVLSTLKGYYINFMSIPKATIPKISSKPAVAHSSGGRSTPNERVLAKLLTPLMNGFHSTLFVVPKEDGGWWLVIDLKQLNAFIEVPH